MDKIELNDLIARAAGDKFLTQEDRLLNGVRKLKREALGFFRTRSIKTLDEMAQILYKTGIVHSVEEGLKLTPALAGGVVRPNGWEHLSFEEAKNGKGEIRYQISYSYYPGGDY